MGPAVIGLKSLFTLVFPIGSALVQFGQCWSISDSARDLKTAPLLNRNTQVLCEKGLDFQCRESSRGK